MDALLLFFAGLVVGLVVGIAVGAVRAFRLVRARRATAGAAAAIGRVALEALPTRSSADILSGRIRIVLGGLPYTIPVLPRRASKEWSESLDASFDAVRIGLDNAAEDAPSILLLLAGHTDKMLPMLRAYDVNGILPDDEYVDEWATDAEILAAMIEVWRAANPLVAAVAEAAGTSTTDETSSAQPSSPLMPTGGDPITSI